ncbi:MAG: prepilin-type N-terminal cleavage/methylation domain-containing protein [Tepidisphaerales bacterium]
MTPFAAPPTPRDLRKRCSRGAGTAPPARPGHPPRRRGLGLVELLISLAITAALLTATAIALDASFRAYRTNQELGDLTQRARLAMHRMLTEIRATQDHEPAPGDLAVFRSGIVVDTTAIRIYTDPDNAIEYRHEGSRIVRQTFRRVGGAWTSEPARALLDGVAPGNFTVTMEPQRSARAARAGLPFDQLRRATIRMTVQQANPQTTRSEMAGNQSVSLVSSVVPRRNAW